MVPAVLDRRVLSLQAQQGWQRTVMNTMREPSFAYPTDRTRRLIHRWRQLMNCDDTQEEHMILHSEDGRPYDCRILGLFEFGGKDYVLFQILEDAGTAEPVATTETQPQILLMRYVKQKDKVTLSKIESDDEFERVAAYAKDIAAGRQFADLEKPRRPHPLK